MINIMLIDDDEAAHTYHTIMMEKADQEKFKVYSFYKVDTALDHLCEMNAALNEKDWPDYIFLDINMPYKSGYDFIDEYRSQNFKFKRPSMYFVSSTKNPFDLAKVEKIEEINGYETKFLKQAFFEKLLETA